MRVGTVEIQAVSDGMLTLDGGTLFGSVPRTQWARLYPPDEQNRISLAMNCYLLMSQGLNILVDTGLGTKLNAAEAEAWGIKRETGLMEGIRNLGLAPEDIHIVVNSHLHPDHCGDNTRYRDGKLVPSFPKAKYLVQRLEWEAATHPNEWSRPQYPRRSFMPVAEAGLLRLIDGEEVITDEVRCLPAPGHTPGHQCVVIESAGDWATILGDVAPFVSQVEQVTWLSSFDMEPMVNLETKKRILEEARRKNGLLFLFHDPDVQACRLVESDGKIRAEGVHQGSAVDS